jgi:hypothetical protein
MDRAAMIEELRRRHLAQQGIVDAPPPVGTPSAFQGMLARGLLTAPGRAVAEGMKGTGMLPRRPPRPLPPVDPRDPLPPVDPTLPPPPPVEDPERSSGE